MATHACTHDIGDHAVLVPVPGKEDGTGTATTIGFFHGDDLRMREIDFVLQNPGWPEDAQEVDALSFAEADENLWRSLRLIAGGSGEFPLLPLAVGENLNFLAH